MNRDPLENFHALESEGISGTFHSHYLGYGTGYLEMSMLYGITELDFGAGTNICFLEDDAYEKFDALPGAVYQERLPGGDAPWV